MALVVLGTANADAKKFHHYSPTLAFLCDDETMTAEVSGDVPRGYERHHHRARDIGGKGRK